MENYLVKQLGIWENDRIEGLKSIVEAVHAEDLKIFIQIHHAGVVVKSENPICPSPYEYKKLDKTVIGREMTNRGYKISTEGFYRGFSRRAYEAGYDGMRLTWLSWIFN